MKVTFEEKGILIKKLFQAREIPYEQVRSVVLSDQEYTVTTKEGETIRFKHTFFRLTKALYEAIRARNIHFRNEDELKNGENVYTLAEVEEKIATVEARIKEYADARLHMELGPEYEIATTKKEEAEWITMYFLLMKNGEVVKDIPEEAKSVTSGYEPDAFEEFELGFLVEWDAYGRYGVTTEVDDWECCEMYMKEALDRLLESGCKRC